MGFLWFGKKQQDDLILDGDLARSTDEVIRLKESAAQLSFAKIIVIGTLGIFFVLTGFAVYFIVSDENTKLETLMDFTGKWFAPVWAILGGLITYFFPNGKK